MRNRYHLKDKKALIHDLVSVKNSGYSPIKYYVPRTEAPIWCYASQLSQDAVFEAKHFGQNETRFFVFNKGTTVGLYDVILYRGGWYEVTRVDTEDDYNTDIYVYVRNLDHINENNVKEYGWIPPAAD